VIASAVVGLWIGFVAGTLVAAVSSTLGTLVFFVFWVGMTYALYRYYHPRILMGSGLLAGAVLCLLLPLGLVLYSASRSGPLAVLVSLGISLIFAVLLVPIGLVLAYFGYRLTAGGSSRLKGEAIQAPHTGIQAQPPATPGAVFCRFCGARIATEHSYCAICGKKQPAAV
jgi:hypothetical protein